MPNYFDSMQSAREIIHRLEDLPAGIDPDFDVERDDLEYEFAVLRLRLETN